MDTRDSERPSAEERYGEEPSGKPGLASWLRRNRWLLLRLSVVIVFSFVVTGIASNFSYGLEGDPVELSVEQINSGNLPAGVEVGDYVKVTGTPDFGEDTSRLGSEESGIGLVSRYETSYFYFPLEETGDNLLIQSAPQPPDLDATGEQTWRGQLNTVGTVIFHDTTQRGLERAGLPRDESIPVVTTGKTPEYYQQIFPAYAAILALWLGSIGWALWKRNQRFL